jgi:hypothetical protein
MAFAAAKVSRAYQPRPRYGAADRWPRSLRWVEVKARADGFRELYSWLEGRDVLIVAADRQEPLVVVQLFLAAEIRRGDHHLLLLAA